MGHDEQTDHQNEATEFFRRFENATPELVGRVREENGADIEAILREERDYGFWHHAMAARAARKTARLEAEARGEWAGPRRGPLRQDPSARRPPLTDESLALLPEVRIYAPTPSDRRAARAFWRSLNSTEEAEIALVLARAAGRATARLRAEEIHRGATARRWQLEQRAFEREQWRAVLAARDERRQRAAAHRWIAIDEDRALQIAIGALNKQHPPQDR